MRLYVYCDFRSGSLGMDGHGRAAHDQESLYSGQLKSVKLDGELQ